MKYPFKFSDPEFTRILYLDIRFLIDLNKVIRTINSCKNYQQYYSVYNMVLLFFNKWAYFSYKNNLSDEYINICSEHLDFKFDELSEINKILMNEKGLDYYLGLEYKPITIIMKNEDGSIYAYDTYCEEFGMFSCRGRGASELESIIDFFLNKNILINELFENGHEIPEPIKEN